MTRQPNKSLPGCLRYSFTALLFTAALAMAGCSKQTEENSVEYTAPDGQKTSDVRDLQDGDVAYQVVGGQPAPAKARQLHEQARAKGESGDYTAALALLKQAIEAAPTWPYPHYDMAFTYLLQGDFTNALAKYREVEQLEPRGFFTTKTALWTLEREDKGIFPKGTYLAYLSLEWVKPEKKRELIEQMTTNLPAFAPAWKEKSLLLEDENQRLALIEKTLSLDPDPETYGICLLNKAALLNHSGKAAEAKRMVMDLSTNASSTLGTKALAKEFLKNFSK